MHEQGLNTHRSSGDIPNLGKSQPLIPRMHLRWYSEQLEPYLPHTTIDSRILGIPSALPYTSLRSAD